MNNKIETEFIKLTEEKWFEYLDLFDDANVYQTIAFAKSSKGGNNLEHFILKIDDEVIAISLVRIVKIPIINRGMAYIRWGPLWCKKNRNNEIKYFDLALKLLYEEYVIKRKFVLRISSGQFKENEPDFKKYFLDNGYYLPDKVNNMTVMIDITKEEDKLRSNLRKHCRSQLNKSQKIGLEVIQGNDDSAFDIFYDLYKLMHKRKKFTEHIDVGTFKKINSILPTNHKMQIFICKLNDKPISATVVSAMGNSGIYLLGGSNDIGLKNSGSYLLQWEVIKWLKSQDIKWYNLGGIDPINGKGVYFFKSGWGGEEVTYSGLFEANKDFLSRTIINIVEKIKK